MSKPCTADWVLGQALWLQGVSCREIAAKLGCPPGTLQKHAWRHGWTKAREQASAVVREAVVQTSVRDLPQIAKNFRKNMAEDAEMTLKALQSKNPATMSLQNLEMRERIADGLTKRAFAVLGIEAAQASVVNIHVLGQLRLEKPENPAADGIKTVDLPENPTNPV